MIQIQLESEEKLFSFWVYGSSSIPSSPWTRKINLDVRLAAKIWKPLWLGKKKNNSLVLLFLGCDGALLEYNYSTRELKKIDQIHVHGLGMVGISSYVATENDDAVDRISQLPDDIILTILSSLSVKEAASTSVLSTRWSDLWRHTPNLVFHNTDHVLLSKKRKEYAKWVNSVVVSHKAPSLKEFNISFPLNYSTRRTLVKLLRLVFSRGVEALVLNMVGKRFSLFENSFLRLKLTNLTSLCLKCLEVSGEAIRLILRSCPLLERLIIKYAVLTSDLEVCAGVLKHLDIQYCKGRHSSLIIGYAPNLTHLRIDSCPELVWDYTRSFLSSPLTTLQFNLHCAESFLEKGFPQMPTLRELIVSFHEHIQRRHSVFRPITSLLCALPYLEELEINVGWFYSYPPSKQKHGIMEAVNNVENICHCNLRVFKFTWFDVGDDDHTKLMSYVLDNCISLQKIILHKYAANSPSHVADWEYVKQLQSKLPSHIQLITS